MIEELRDEMRKAGVTEAQIDEFFKDLTAKRVTKLSEIELQKHMTSLEQQLLERFLGKKDEIKEQNEYNVTSNMATDADQEEKKLS